MASGQTNVSKNVGGLSDEIVTVNNRSNDVFYGIINYNGDPIALPIYRADSVEIPKGSIISISEEAGVPPRFSPESAIESIGFVTPINFLAYRVNADVTIIIGGSTGGGSEIG